MGDVNSPVLAPTPSLVRRRNGRIVAGVAGGVADHLGVDVLWVRAAFVILTGVSGAGVLAYGLLWIFVRQERSDVERAPGRAERQQALGLAALGIGGGIAVATLGNSVVGWIIGPLGVAAAGAAVVWREADDAQRRRWTAGARGISGTGRTAVLRVVAGAVFVAVGIAVFLIGQLQLGQVQFALLAVVAALVGVGVITVPWWLRLMRDLGEERRERIVEAERADIAAHLHDSVLQTLALIQRQAGDAPAVTRLARAQERELRSWLYAGPQGSQASLASAVTEVAHEVEDLQGVPIDLVVTGDRPHGPHGIALARAMREALLNASRHGAPPITAYVEIGPDGVEAFVRDRGAGFDLDAVPGDRLGVRESILGRMQRHGGTATVRRLDDGTEVELRLPPIEGEQP